MAATWLLSGSTAGIEKGSGCIGGHGQRDRVWSTAALPCSYPLPTIHLFLSPNRTFYALNVAAQQLAGQHRPVSHIR
jgi:hypothetical protein